MTIDLYDTRRCPTCFRCEACGTADGLLAPWAVRINRGVMCLTLCPGCLQTVTRDNAIPVADSTAEKFVAQHREHVGVTAQNMAEMLAAEDRRTHEQTVAGAEAAALGAVNGFANGSHGTYPPDHEHVHCSVCGDGMVHVNHRTDGTRTYAAHPSIVGEPHSVQCSNTDFAVGTHRGNRVPSPRRR